MSKYDKRLKPEYFENLLALCLLEAVQCGELLFPLFEIDDDTMHTNEGPFFICMYSVYEAECKFVLYITLTFSVQKYSNCLVSMTSSLCIPILCRTPLLNKM